MCERAEEFLKQNKIRYKRFDIEKSTAGKLKYRKLGLSVIPVLKVGSTVIPGFDPSSYHQAIADKRR